MLINKETLDAIKELNYKQVYEKGIQDTLKAIADGKIVKPFRCPICDKITTLTCVECAEKEFTQEEKARLSEMIMNEFDFKIKWAKKPETIINDALASFIIAWKEEMEIKLLGDAE